MDERIEIWDASGVPTGRTALKSEAHRRGWYHPTVHIWFYTASGEVLLQKRAASKETFPGLWDVSVAGHVQDGETPVQAALREILEEIGLRASADDLDFLGRFRSEHRHPGGLVDREFHHCYLARLNQTVGQLRPQPGEVAELRLQPLLTFAEEVWGMAHPGEYVPHPRAYYAEVVKGIRSRL